MTGRAPVTAAVPSTLAARRADALRARRAELADRRRLLVAGPRADVATVLDLARLACLDGLSADLARVAERASARIERARPAELAGLPADLAADLAVVGERLDRTFTAHTAPDLRRLAARLCPGAAPLPVPDVDRSGAAILRAAAGPAPTPRTVLSDPRLLATTAGLPVLAVHGIGVGSALVVAGTVLLVGCLGRARAVVAERARLREHVARSVAAAGTAGERELRRRLIGTEAALGAALDRAVRDRADVELTAGGGPRGAAG